jgi:hypothetical protein
VDISDAVTPPGLGTDEQLKKAVGQITGVLDVLGTMGVRGYAPPRAGGAVSGVHKQVQPGRASSRAMLIALLGLGLGTVCG